MKLKQGFVMREIAGETIVVPSGEELNLNMMITLNETGKFIWNCLEAGADMDEVAQKLSEEYDVDKEKARQDAEVFLNKLRENGFLED